MGEILSFLPTLFGQLLYFINNVVGNYGLAIILLTIIIRLIIFPLTIKQLQSAARQQELQPRLTEIQERYKNDKEKQQQETMKFYKEEKFNPFGGCLPLLVQMPIFISMYNAFIYPMTYQLNQYTQSMAIKAANELNKVNDVYYELHHVINNQSTYNYNMNFLGIKLGHVVDYNIFNPTAQTLDNYLLIVLALLATGLTYLSIKISMKRPGQPLPPPGKNGAPNQMAQMNKTMMLMMPALTFMFTLSFPAGLILYWATGYVIQIFQQLAINKWFHGRKKEVAK